MRLLSRLAAIVAFASMFSSPPAASANLPWLHTRGTSIVDERGTHVRLTGFNEGGMYEGADGNIPDVCGARWRELPPSLPANLQRWGFNSLRLHISWSNLEPTPPTVAPDGTVLHHWNTTYLEALDRLVANAGAHGVYVIPVMTQAAVSPAYKRFDGKACEGSGMPAWLFPNAVNEIQWQGWCHFFGNQPVPGVGIRPLDGYAAAWRQIARRFAHTPAVAGLDLLNEPGSAFYPCHKMGVELRATYLDDFNRRIGSAIRAVNPRVMIVVEDSSYTEGPYGHFIGSKAGLRNVMYEWHNYSRDWAHVRPALEQQVRFARRLGVPLWLGEFAAFDAAMNGLPPSTPDWQSDLRSMMAFLRAHDVSWSMQNYSGRSSILRPGTSEPKTELLDLLRLGMGTPSARAARLEAQTDETLGATPGSAWPCFSPRGFTCSYERGTKVLQMH